MKVAEEERNRFTEVSRNLFTRLTAANQTRRGFIYDVVGLGWVVLAAYVPSPSNDQRGWGCMRNENSLRGAVANPSRMLLPPLYCCNKSYHSVITAPVTPTFAMNTHSPPPSSPFVLLFPPRREIPSTRSPRDFFFLKFCPLILRFLQGWYFSYESRDLGLLLTDVGSILILNRIRVNFRGMMNYGLLKVWWIILWFYFFHHSFRNKPFRNICEKRRELKRVARVSLKIFLKRGIPLKYDWKCARSMLCKICIKYPSYKFCRGNSFFYVSNGALLWKITW